MANDIKYRGRFSVPFFWADPAGILFFGNLFMAAQAVWEEWARATPEGWASWYDLVGVAYPLRHVEADYLSAMRFGEIFEVYVRVESVGDSTFTLLTEFVQEGRVHAQVKSVHTAFDIQAKKKGAISAAMRTFLG